MMYPNSMVSLLVYNQAVAEIERLKQEIKNFVELPNKEDFEEKINDLVAQNDKLKEELKLLRQELANSVDAPKKAGRPRKTESEK